MYHLWTLKWPRYLKSFLIENKTPCIIRVQRYGCWWPCNATSKGKIDLVIPKYFGFSTRRVKCFDNSEKGILRRTEIWSDSKPIAWPRVCWKYAPTKKYIFTLRNVILRCSKIVVVDSLRLRDANMRITCSLLGQYLSQCWLIVNLTLSYKFQWYIRRNSNIFIQENGGHFVSGSKC